MHWRCSPSRRGTGEAARTPTIRPCTSETLNLIWPLSLHFRWHTRTSTHVLLPESYDFFFIEYFTCTVSWVRVRRRVERPGMRRVPLARSARLLIVVCGGRRRFVRVRWPDTGTCGFTIPADLIDLYPHMTRSGCRPVLILISVSTYLFELTS